MSVDLQPFVDRLLARSVLNSAERQAILDLPTKRVLLRAREDFVRLDEETDHSCYIARGSSRGLVRSAVARARSPPSTFRATWPISIQLFAQLDLEA